MDQRQRFGSTARDHELFARLRSVHANSHKLRTASGTGVADWARSRAGEPASLSVRRNPEPVTDANSAVGYHHHAASQRRSRYKIIAQAFQHGGHLLQVVAGVGVELKGFNGCAAVTMYRNSRPLRRCLSRACSNRMAPGAVHDRCGRITSTKRPVSPCQLRNVLCRPLVGLFREQIARRPGDGHHLERSIAVSRYLSRGGAVGHPAGSMGRSGDVAWCRRRAASEDPGAHEKMIHPS